MPLWQPLKQRGVAINRSFRCSWQNTTTRHHREAPHGDYPYTQDVERLLSEPSADVRAELADKVAANLAGAGLTLAEVSLAQDIVRVLSRDVEAAVRAAVSRRLRHSPHLPRDVAKRLADDIDIVALPFWLSRWVLTDEDLVDLVKLGSASKQETIAARPHLGEVVSDALIRHAANRRSPC